MALVSATLGAPPVLELLQYADTNPEKLFRAALSKAAAVINSESLEGSLPSSAPRQGSVLVQHLGTLKALLTVVSDAQELSQLAEEVVQSVCVPYIRALSALLSMTAATAAVADLLCMILCDERLIELGHKTMGGLFVSLARSLASDLCLSVHSVCEAEAGSSSTESPDPQSVVTFLLAVLGRVGIEDRERNAAYDRALSALFSELVAALQRCDLSVCFLLAGSLLPLFVTEHHHERVRDVWDFIERVFSEETRVEADKFTLVSTLVCCFCDVFIPYDSPSPFSTLFNEKAIAGAVSVVDVRKRPLFWAVLQEGLASSDPLSRKRCKYLLHRVLASVQQLHDGRSSGHVDIASGDFVFWWSRAEGEELARVWSDLMLLLETIEEKQVHIIKPVRSRLKNIIAATCKSIDGHSLLHLSWLVVTLSRVFVHETKSTVRWGLQELLDTSLRDSPFLRPENWKFVFSPLLKVLNEAHVYAREQRMSEIVCPPAASSLSSFLQRFLTELPAALTGTFMAQFVSTCSAVQFADIPLVYVSYTLSSLPPAPLLGADSLAAIRSIVLTGILNCKASIRSTIQCFLLATVCNLTNLTSVCCEDMTTTLGTFSATECLVFGSTAWIQAREWLARYCSAASQGLHPEDAPTTAPLFDFLETALNHSLGIIQRSNDDGQVVGLRLTSLAQILLLATDAECSGNHSRLLSTSGRSLSESVTALLSPAMDIIVSARTRLYMLHSTVRSALEFLASLLQIFLGGMALASSGMWQGVDSLMGMLLFSCLSPWLPNIMIYLQEELLTGSEPESNLPSLSRIKFFAEITDQLCLFWQLFECLPAANVGPSRLAPVVCKRIANMRMGKSAIELTPALLGTITALSWICRLWSSRAAEGTEAAVERRLLLDCLNRLPAFPKFTKPKEMVQTLSESSSSFSGVPIDWGSLVSHTLSCVWQCASYALQHVGEHLFLGPGVTEESSGESVVIGCRDIKLLAEEFLSSLDVAGEGVAAPVHCLSLLLPKLIVDNAQFVVDSINTTWPLIMEQRDHHVAFLGALKSFIQLSFHPLLLDSSDPLILELQLKYAATLRELGELRTGVYNLLVDHVCAVWLEGHKSSRDGENCTVSSLVARSDLLLQAVLFGSVYQKNRRPLEDVELFIKSLADQCSSNCFNFKQTKGDSDVRITALSFLVEIAGTSEQNAEKSDSSLLRFFLPKFIDTLVKKIMEISSLKPKYHLNSFTHRTKLRMVQALLLLLNWADESTACSLVDGLLRSLQHDNQLSVRYMIEWAMVLLLSKHPHLVESMILRQLELATGWRLSRMCSLFTIALHVGLSMETAELKADYYRESFPAVFQWCASHHFVVRLYSQYTAVRIWEEMSTFGLKDLLRKFSLFSGSMTLMQQSGDVAKFSAKLEDNVMLSKLRAKADFSMETVFHVLPHLCNVLDEEQIRPDKFCQGSPVWRTHTSAIQLRCTNEELWRALRDESASSRMESGIKKSSVGLRSPNVSKEDKHIREGNVQKKITPWSTAAAAGLLDELFPGHPTAFSVRSGALDNIQTGIGGELVGSSGLVVVASLLHKAPNLGGLCRTCEIFGVSELVLHNAKIVEDKMFQSLSVTAEKWISITEVKLPVLREYLLSMRQRGYSLVGVEQTAQSRVVTEFKFKRKTVLVLGNEREGIPVEFIHLLDDCVEIPQLGVVRSLNVHVCGALLVWEYTKQHTLLDKL